MTSQPWHDLPRDVVDVLGPVLPEVADDMIEAVRQVPAYARPLEGDFGRGLRAGVEVALRHFLAEIEAGGPVARSDAYVVLGRGEMRAGRSLDSLLSAYRTGARVAWRRFAEIGSRAGLAPATMYRLAEALFAYIDMLSAESAEGHALEQSLAAGETERRRRRLVRLLVREPGDPQIIQAAASEAGWALPRTLGVLALAGDRREAAAAHLPPDALSDTVDELTCVLLPDPDGPGRRATVERVVVDLGLRGGLGTTVSWREAQISFRRAKAALALAGDERPALVPAAGRMGDLLLAADPRLARELVAERLAPLAGLPAGSRNRLTETLAVWLEEQGRLGQVAARVHVHPQTARYRLTRLRELFGEALDDPDERFWLQLALRLRTAGAA